MSDSSPTPQAVRALPHPERGSELQLVQAAVHRGVPFLLHRPAPGPLTVVPLERDRLSIGRHSSCEVCLADDREISRSHAVVERIGHAWFLIDDGVSRNGTVVNGVRISGRHALNDGDVLRVGVTLLVFRLPQTNGDASLSQTAMAVEALTLPDLTPMQRKVLAILCRPARTLGPYATPATNQQIADELVLSLDAVKTHMRGLFDRFDVKDLPQNQKRSRVVERAFRFGLVAERES